ncbi:MAG: class I SAM-dependent methyltransferase [Candidatus Nanoarchaeia archaeon]|jgi:SAM-dependent methyltransferase
MQTKNIQYYNNKYFEWQKTAGKLGGILDLFKFKEFIMPTDKVIDFGCGGGYLLANINCAEKKGIEINENAWPFAKQNKVDVVKSAEDIQDNWADVIISNHALEHTLNPYGELRKLYPKLKKGGRIVFVLPHEIRSKYIPGDVNQHLYTWSPMCAGNLFTTAGYKVERVETIKYQWPPYYQREILTCLGKGTFDLLSRIYARVYPFLITAKTVRNIYHLQVRVIARK